MNRPPTLYARCLLVAIKHADTFSVMAILRGVNSDGHEQAGVMQVKKTLDRMQRNGLLVRKALGVFAWKHEP